MKGKPLPSNPCARSRCGRPGLLIPGKNMRLCLAHAEAKVTRKYKNRPAHSELANRRFDSDAERRYCETLVLLERSGAITNLEFQKTFKLEVNGMLVCSYRADAVYLDSTGVQRVVDVKGMVLPEFKLKAKLFRAVMGFDIQIVYPDKQGRPR